MSGHDPRENLPPHVVIDGVRVPKRDGVDVYVSADGWLCVNRSYDGWEAALIGAQLEIESGECDSPERAAKALTILIRRVRADMGHLRSLVDAEGS